MLKRTFIVAALIAVIALPFILRPKKVAPATARMRRS
jgi:hypothetical protein